MSDAKVVHAAAATPKAAKIGMGLGVIAVKFLLRVLLLLSGRVSLDPEAALQEEDLANAQERDDEAAREGAT